MSRIRSVVFAHVLASYAFAAISSIEVAFEVGLSNAKFVLLKQLSLETLAAPATMPYVLVIDLGFYFHGHLWLWQVLELWAEYLIPLILI